MTVFSMMAVSLLAQATNSTPPGSFNPMNMNIIMILMLVMMYFVIFRPQRQKQKQAEETQKALQSGDEVITIGGAHGVVTTVKEKTVVIRVAEGKIEFDRTAIATRVAKSAASATES